MIQVKKIKTETEDGSNAEVGLWVDASGALTVSLEKEDDMDSVFIDLTSALDAAKAIQKLNEWCKTTAGMAKCDKVAQKA